MKVFISSKILNKAFCKTKKVPTKYIRFGRGARNIHDPFHQAFLDERDRLRPAYRRCRTHKEKRVLQLQLLKWVKDKNGKFMEVSANDKNLLVEVKYQKRLLEKCAQALREPRKKALSKVATKSVSSTKGPRAKIVKNVKLPQPDIQVKKTDPMFHGVPVTKGVHALRELYQASKAVHRPIPAVHSTEQFHVNDASSNGWNEKEDDFTFFQCNCDIASIGKLDVDPLDEYDPIITLRDDCSISTDRLMDEAPTMNPTTDETSDIHDVDYFMNMPEDEFLSVAKELFIP